MAWKRAPKALRKTRRARRRWPSAAPLPPKRLKRPLPPLRESR